MNRQSVAALAYQLKRHEVRLPIHFQQPAILRIRCYPAPRFNHHRRYVGAVLLPRVRRFNHDSGTYGHIIHFVQEFIVVAVQPDALFQKPLSLVVAFPVSAHTVKIGHLTHGCQW